MAEGGADVDFGRDEQQKVREENNDDLEWEDEFEQNPDGQTQETSFGGGEVEQLGLEGSKKELLKQKLNAFYSDVEKKTGYRPTIDLDPNKFRLEKGDRLEAKWGRSWVELTNEKNPRKFKSLRTIRDKTDVEFIKGVLGLIDF